MKFIVVSMLLAPDTDMGRHLYQLDNLSEKDVAKILFHKRKQESGHTEELRLALQRVVALSRLKFQDGRVAISTHTAPEFDESDMLAGMFKMAKSADHLVTWNGTKIEVPLLRYRAMHYQLRSARFWRRLQGDAGYHLDLTRSLVDGNERANTSLDELAICMRLPGLLESAVLDPWQARMAGDFEALRSGTELAVLNLYLLALRYWFVTGHFSHSETKAAKSTLREWLGKAKAPHLRSFLDRWSTKD